MKPGDMKRQWNRIDPEPPKPCSKCAWQQWETYVWAYTAFIALALILAIATGGGE